MSLRQDLTTVANAVTTLATQIGNTLKTVSIRRLTAPPATFVVGTRWQEITTTGVNKYPWVWVWDGTHWISDNFFYPFVISSSRLTGSNGTYRSTLSYTNTPGIDTVKVLNPQVVCGPDGSGSNWSMTISTVATAGAVVLWLSHATAPNLQSPANPLWGFGANGLKTKTIPLMTAAQALLKDILELEFTVTRNTGNASSITTFRCNMHPVRPV